MVPENCWNRESAPEGLVGTWNQFPSELILLILVLSHH
jgi:hypothetical protein